MNNNLPNRQSIRLKEYDYSRPGAYFITFCTQNRQNMYGEIKNGKMVLNDAGKMIQTVWDEIPIYYNGINIDEFVIMPNHIHGIIMVGAGPRACPIENKGENKNNGNNGQPRINCGPPQGGNPTGVGPTILSLPDVVHRLKTMTTKRYTDGVKQFGWKRFNKRLWQRNYWEHIVRNENELNRIRNYIKNNPVKWQKDKLNGGCGNKVLEPLVEYGEEKWMI